MKEIDSLQEPAELLFVELLHSLLTIRPWESIFLQSLAPQAEPIPVPVECFHQVLAPITEQVQRSAERIAFELLLYEHCQSGGLFSHICSSRSDEDPRIRPIDKHHMLSSTCTTSRSRTEGQSRLTSSRISFRSVIIISAPREDGFLIGSSTSPDKLLFDEYPPSFFFQYPKVFRLISSRAQNAVCVIPLRDHASILSRHTSSFDCERPSTTRFIAILLNVAEESVRGSQEERYRGFTERLHSERRLSFRAGRI
jgi:hypothetical protein